MTVSPISLPPINPIGVPAAADTTVAVRNEAVEAFGEIKRMQV